MLLRLLFLQLSLMRWRKPWAVWSNRAVHREPWRFLRHSDEGVKQYLLVEMCLKWGAGNGFNCVSVFFFSSCLSILQWMMWLMSRKRHVLCQCLLLKIHQRAVMKIFSPDLGFRYGIKSAFSWWWLSFGWKNSWVSSLKKGSQEQRALHVCHSLTWPS